MRKSCNRCNCDEAILYQVAVQPRVFGSDGKEITDADSTVGFYCGECVAFYANPDNKNLNQEGCCDNDGKTIKSFKTEDK